jgi:hypothetical protein
LTDAFEECRSRRQTQVDYAPSTRFYPQDRAAGRVVTKLPFPVHVVVEVKVIDQITNTTVTTQYAYHHGYYDGSEREFRGFAMVEQWDDEVRCTGGRFPFSRGSNFCAHDPALPS